MTDWQTQFKETFGIKWPKLLESLGQTLYMLGWALLLGAVIGYFAGFGFAQIIGHTVFSSAIDMKPMVIPVVIVLVVVVTLAGSIPAIRMLLRLRPAEVLHGR